eukprot:gene25116-28396_t
MASAARTIDSPGPTTTRLIGATRLPGTLRYRSLASFPQTPAITVHVPCSWGGLVTPCPSDTRYSDGAPAGAVQEVRVEGAKENEFKADRAASGKYTELLVNTPQTITVIKRELIEQQGA